MIAKIGHGTHLAGALYYNEDKVDQGHASVLMLHKMQETVDNKYTVTQLMRSFEPYLAANKKTEKPALHISLNPDPSDVVSDAQYIQIAQQYMQEMGYGEQPYILFKHTDIERSHIHIVSTNVDRSGRKISDTFEKRRSMEVCRKLETTFGLRSATDKAEQEQRQLFRPVNHLSGSVKSQIASVVRHLPRYYQFQTFGAYNALLSLFNITAEHVAGEIGGKPRNGMLYFAIDEKGEKISLPFKSSLFGKAAGWEAMNQHFQSSKTVMTKSKSRPILKNCIEVALHSSTTEIEFKQQLKEQGINTVVRRNIEGRIYGITFIDHESRTVWNGSQLDKNLSANTFNEQWKKGPEKEARQARLPMNSVSSQQASPAEEVHPFFLFVDPNRRTDNSPNSNFSFLSDLMDQPHGENFEEIAFENMVKKKGRKRRKK